MTKTNTTLAKPTRFILPSFLRRVMKAYALKTVMREAGGDLARVGRSRHWQLTATPEQIHEIIAFIETANEESWLWLIKTLKENSQQFSHSLLINIAKKNSGITVNELMAKTDCTLAQARKVIDEIEWDDKKQLPCT